MSFLGLNDPVDYSLLKGLAASFANIPGGIAISASGTIMESAKVFKSLQAEESRNNVLVTVYASLAFWNRRGSPDFSMSKEVKLAPGNYEVWYASPRAERKRLGSVAVPSN